MITGRENIQSLIPQRPPFVMVDQLEHVDELTTRTSFQVRPDNIFLQNGRLREPAMVENIAQTAAARAGYRATEGNQPVLVGFIGAVTGLKVHGLPELNDILETEIVVKNQIFDVTIITGTVSCNGNIMAQCDMKIFLINPNK